MLACAFPPTGGVGVMRMVKFAKYLPTCGWTPWVWSADYVPGLPRDESLRADLPSSLEHETLPTRDPALWLEQKFAGFRKHPRLYRPYVEGLEWRLGNWARWWLARSFPDDQASWARKSYHHLRRTLKNRRVNVIFSTFSPASNHWLAWRLHRATGIPWVADFRDLWTDDGEVPQRWWGRRWAQRRLERQCLKTAAAVTATDHTLELLARHLPEEREKFHLVPNGVDLEDFASLRAHNRGGVTERQDEKFRLSFVGQFRETRVTPEYYEGIARFLRADAERRAHFELRVVGSISADLQERARQAGINLTVTGHLPHREALREMVEADVLLLSTACRANSTHVIPAKTYEYLAAGRPILVVGAPDSDVLQLVEDNDAGVGVGHDPDALAEALGDYWEAWRVEQLPTGCTLDELERYSRQTATRQLADIFSQVCGITPAAAEPRTAPAEKRKLAGVGAR